MDPAIIDEGVSSALASIRDHFETPADPRDILAYHNTLHTSGVVRRVKLIIDAIQAADPQLISPRERQLGVLAAAYHDTVQRWQLSILEKEDFSITKRQRFIVQNEVRSAVEAVTYMDTVNQQANREVFSNADKALVTDAILVTIPTFDSETGTVIQKRLTPDSHPMIRSVALADLGMAGIDGLPNAEEDTYTLFQEEVIGFSGVGKSDAAIRDRFIEYYLGWDHSRLGFIKGRRELLERELEGLPTPARDKVRGLFGRFDLSLARLEELRTKTENTPSSELVRRLDYEEFEGKILSKSFK